MIYGGEERNKRQSDRYKKRRAEYLNEQGPCKLCGSWIKLELHHRDPKSKISTKIWHLSEKRRIVEIAKCDILCRSCHSRKLFESLKHGTVNCYNNFKCRCKFCKKAESIRKCKQYKKKKLK